MSPENRIKVPYAGNEHDAVQVRVTSDQERWNEYVLDDGSLLRMKLVVKDIARLVDVYDEQGNPVYVVASQNVVNLRANPKLKRPNA